MKLFSRSIIAMWIFGSAVACASTPNLASNISTTDTGLFVSESNVVVRAEYRSDETVSLTFADGTTKILSHALSGSGVRYADGAYDWWERQGEATYSLGDKTIFTGKLKQ